MEEKRYYIAYGSNLNVRQMRGRCPGARIIGTGRIADYALLFRGSRTGSYLTIEKAEGKHVPIVLWEVTEEDIKALDFYEGCPQFYYKTDMRVTVRGIRSGRLREHDAFVYIMHEDRARGLPDIQYVLTCEEGYRHFGFDRSLIREAVLRSEEMMR